MPMDSPGIEIRPLRTIEGTTEFAELFLNEVRIPVANRVGDENDGWRVTMVTLSFERGTAFVGELLECMRLLGELRDVGRAARPARATTGWPRRIGHLVAAFDALWALTKRNVSEAAQTGVPGIGGSVFKLSFSEHAQALGDLAMEMLDRAALCADPLDGPDGAARQRRAAAQLVQVDLADHRGGHLAGPAQHRGRAHPRPAQGALMDFRVSDDQRELAEGIRAMLAGRLPLEHVRAREGDERGDRRRRLGRAGRDRRLRPDAARARRHRPGPGRRRRRLRGARPGPVPGPLVGHVPGRGAGAGRRRGRGQRPGRLRLRGRPGPVLVEHLASLDALLVLPDDRRRGPRCSRPRRRRRRAPHGARRSTR